MTSMSHIHDQRFGFGFDLSSTDDNIEVVHHLREQYLETKDYSHLNVDTLLPTGKTLPPQNATNALFNSQHRTHLLAEAHTHDVMYRVGKGGPYRWFLY